MSIFNDTAFQFDPRTPIYQQIYEHMRVAILSGQLKRGTKIPSTRALADELGISRNTVLNAYDQLFAEGYLESAEGRGTFITRVLPDAYFSIPQPTKSRPQQAASHHLSERAQAAMESPGMPVLREGQGRQAFRAGLPSLDDFPFDLWGKLVARHAHRLNPNNVRYQDSTGYRPLREAIANHVIVARQVHCTPDQVIIVSGSQGGLDLTTRVLLNPGETAWMEDPGYLGARGALVAAGARLVPLPVDEDGLQVEIGIQRAPDARLVYLTPSHQFPLGVTMSLSRRLALLEWAKTAGAYVMEDDYDSEYRFGGRPLASLQGLDTHERIIYIGTFSKVMFPALRLGYLIVPPGLVDAFLGMRRFVDYHPSILEQAALADFMSEGHFTRHIRRMRTLYAERRAILLDAARDLPLDIYAPEAGMHVVGWLPEGVDDRAVAAFAAEQNIEVMPISAFAIEPLKRGGLVLGYAGIDEMAIRERIHRLGIVLASFLRV